MMHEKLYENFSIKDGVKFSMINFICMCCEKSTKNSKINVIWFQWLIKSTYHINYKLTEGRFLIDKFFIALFIVLFV